MQTHMSLCTCEYVHCFVKLNMFQGESNSEIYTPTGKGTVVLEGVNFGECPPPHRANVGKKIIFQALSWGLN